MLPSAVHKLTLACLLVFGFGVASTWADTTGFYVLGPPSQGTFDAYTDNGTFIYELSSSGVNSSSFVTNTVFVDTTALANYLPNYLKGSTFYQENFNSPTNMSFADNLASSGCSLASCGVLPGNNLSTSPDGSSVSGTVGVCGGPPHCTVNGWAYSYVLDLKFSQPIYAFFGTLSDTAGVSTAYKEGETLPSPQQFSFNSQSPQQIGWIFPYGVTDLFISNYTTINTTLPFRLSDVEVAIGGTPAPEPASVWLCGVAVVFGFWKRLRSFQELV